MLEQLKDAVDVFHAEPGFLGNSLLVIALVPEPLNACEQLQGAALTPGDVLGQAHDERIIVVHIDDHSRNFGLAKRLECLHSAFTADQQVPHLTVSVGTGSDRDGLLQADLFDVAHDVVKDPLVSLSGVEHFDRCDRDHF